MANEFTTRMADLARDLRSQRSSVMTLQHVVTATAEMVKNSDDVAITLAHADGTIETRASTGVGLAEQADQLQADYRQGPCLNGGWDTPVIRIDDLAQHDAWPAWRMSLTEELGLRSYLCVQLFTHEQHDLGSLQVFSTQVDAFDEDAADEAQGIAAHAAVALGAVANLEAMQFGLVRRTMIGQATGILMERYSLDQHQAFEVLRRSSQETGVKVYALAIDLVTGKRPSGL